jgi:hypothetical protein
MQVSGLPSRNGSTSGRQVRPEQKNIDLVKEIMVSNNRPGRLVYDPCSGVGSAAIPAHELGSPIVMTPILWQALSVKSKGARWGMVYR